MPDTNHRSSSSPIRARVIAGLLLVAASVAAGCNVIVPVAYVIEGPGTIPAEFVLRDTSTAVFVDDRDNAFPRTALRAIVGVEITQALIDNKAVTPQNLVDARDVIALVRALETSGTRASIERIGREAGVEQVVYVELEGFSLTLDGVTPRPTAVCSVKVLDLAAGMRVFPADGTDNREVDPALFESFAKRRVVEDDLAVRLGRDVAKLFYEHERVDLGENLGIR
ncbi:MAG: hypothetical protein VX726_04080 [Planctomycetota bacterium]|nr:hypothetical protein [Planctomycetota bacterium]